MNNGFEYSSWDKLRMLFEDTPHDAVRMHGALFNLLTQ